MPDATLAISLPLHEPAQVFVVLFLVILAAPIVAARSGIPAVIALIVGGVLIGEHVTNLVAREGAVELLGGVGLLFLMFMAGAELDLDELTRQRRGSIVFGIATLVIPLAIGLLVIRAMGFTWLAALLLASCWASHTIVAYPIFQRHCVVTSRAVAVTIGATVLTDTAALLVLVVAARAHEGDLTATFLAAFVPKLAVAGLALLWALPRGARWFFGRHADSRSGRFVFIVAAAYAGATIAELAGIEAIVGAFLAGLVLNRQIPNDSVLMSDLEAFGSNFLVPMFLISVGMLVDPMVVVEDPASLGTAAGFLAVALGAKALAAVVSGKILGFSRPEMGTMFALSSAQAAATLAAVLVGLEIGLIESETVNAVVIVILATCLASSYAANRYAAQLHDPEERPVRIGTRLLVALQHDGDLGPLAELAAPMGAADTGIVTAIKVLPTMATTAEVQETRTQLLALAEQTTLSHGVELRPVVRLDHDATSGILHAVTEHDATALVVGWHNVGQGRQVFSTSIDALVEQSDVPVLVVRRGADDETKRVVLVVDELGPAVRPGVALAGVVARRLADQRGVPLVVLTRRRSDWLDAQVHELGDPDVEVLDRAPHLHIRERTDPGDLLVTGTAAFPFGGGSTPSLLARATERTVVTVVPRLGSRTETPEPAKLPTEAVAAPAATFGDVAEVSAGD